MNRMAFKEASNQAGAATPGSFDPATPDNEEKFVTFGEDGEPVTPQKQSAVLPPKQTDYVREAPINGLGLAGDSLLAKQKLDLEPKEPVFIPLDPGEVAGKAYRPITINGYRIEIRKNVMVNVAKSVAELVRSSYNMEDAVQSQHALNLANRDDKTRSALS